MFFVTYACADKTRGETFKTKTAYVVPLMAVIVVAIKGDPLVELTCIKFEVDFLAALKIL